jgi:hypothetical protein
MMVVMAGAYMLFLLRLYSIMLLSFLDFLQILLALYLFLNNRFMMLALFYSSFISICRLGLFNLILLGSFHLGDMIE